jgi:hypothetical protein
MRAFGVFVVGLLAATLPSLGRADLAIYEPFNYLNGNLDGNTNPTAPATIDVGGAAGVVADTNKWSTGDAGAAMVIDGDLTYAGLSTTPTGHMSQLRTLPATLAPTRIGIGEFTESTNPTLYFSLLLQVPADAATYGTSNTTGSFLTGFQYNPSNLSNAGMTSTPAGAAGVLLIRRVGDAAPGTGYNLGIAFRDTPSSATGASARVFDASHELHGGDTVFVVGKLQINAGSQNDVASLFLNPDPTAAEPAAANAVSDAAVILAGSTTNYDYMYNNSNGGQIETKIRSFFLRSNGVEPTNINIDELRVGTTWADVTGQAVTPPPVPGDFNGDRAVNAADLTVWQGSYGMTGAQPADGNGDGLVDGADFLIWQSNLGNAPVTGVPEPAAALLALGMMASGLLWRRRAR